MDFHELLAYQKAFQLAMDIFEISKSFPKEEKYSLTDQIRRSSRSVCAQIAEGYRKREYPKFYKSKFIDADGENSETQVWLQFAWNCQYINESAYKLFLSKSDELGRLIGNMIKNPVVFGVKVKPS